MNISRIFALAFLRPSAVFAQGKPAQPGPPSAQPQSVVNATGKVVGEIIAGGCSGASIKYLLSTGDFVVLSATPLGLSNFGVVLPGTLKNTGLDFKRLAFDLGRRSCL